MKKATRNLIRDYGMTIGVAVLAALAVRTFVIEAYRIPTPSMHPTLEPGDTLFVAKWPFGLRWPRSMQPFTQGRLPVRGEPVVYRYQLPEGDRVDSIKRVIGLPGDRVALKQGIAWVNGQPLAPASSQAACVPEQSTARAYSICREPPLLADLPEEVVPAGNVYLLPDFRSQAGIEPEQRSGPHIVPLFALRGKPLRVWMSVEPSASWFPQIRWGRIFRRVE